MTYKHRVCGETDYSPNNNRYHDLGLSVFLLGLISPERRKNKLMFDQITITPDENGLTAKIEKDANVYFVRGNIKTIFKKIGNKIKKICK